MPNSAATLRGALGVRVHNADEFGAFEFAPHAHMVAAEFSGADDGNANGFFAHDFFPFLLRAVLRRQTPEWRFPLRPRRESMRRGRTAACGPRRLPAPWRCERRITSIVFMPITGTSKRMSCCGLLTFTTTSRWPPVMRAARSMVSSVPSIASMATQARSRTTTVWPEIESGNLLRDVAAVFDVRGFRFVRRAPREQRPPQAAAGREISSNPPARCLRLRARARRRRSANPYFSPAAKTSNFARRQSGRIELKILLCFTCPAITACFTPSWCSKFNRAAQFAEAHPVEPLGGALECRRSFFANGDHGHFDAAAARAFEHEKRKITVSGDQAPIPLLRCLARRPRSSYFVKPRSADSINRIRVKTSSESERVPRIFSTACVVLSFERSSRR